MAAVIQLHQTSKWAKRDNLPPVRQPTEASRTREYLTTDQVERMIGISGSVSLLTKKQAARMIGYKSLASFTQGHSVFVISPRGEVLEFKPDRSPLVSDDLLSGSSEKWSGKSSGRYSLLQ